MPRSSKATVPASSSAAAAATVAATTAAPVSKKRSRTEAAAPTASVANTKGGAAKRSAASSISAASAAAAADPFDLDAVFGDMVAKKVEAKQAGAAADTKKRVRTRQLRRVTGLLDRWLILPLFAYLG